MHFRNTSLKTTSVAFVLAMILPMPMAFAASEATQHRSDHGR